MLRLRALVALAITCLAAFPSFSTAAPGALSQIESRGLKFPYGSEKVRGVNLGGWFVLEPWITPSIFEKFDSKQGVVDEYTLCAKLGKKKAHKRLKHHWDTWIKKGDFHDIRSKGLNYVRIPIGYWSVIPRKGDPYVQGAYKKLGESLNWAHAAGLKVMIDLHGAAESQNGFDNSGRAGRIGWQGPGTVSHTERVLEKIKRDHAHHPAVAAIQLVNEPFGPSLNVGKIKSFYKRMNKKIKGHGVAVAIHDAFMGVNSWNDFGNKHHWLLDTHHYEVFDSSLLQLDIGGHVSSACNFGGAMSTNNKVTIAGEWTGAMTDCAKWLNGRGYGARYDGSFSKNGQTSYYIGSCKGLHKGTVHGLSAQHKANIRQFTEAQMDAYEFAGGWIWWTWKTESAPEWDFKALANAGVIPQPLSSRKYPGQCG